MVPPTVEQMTEDLAEIIAAARFWSVDPQYPDRIVIGTREPIQTWVLTVELES